MAKERKDFSDTYKWNTKDLFEDDKECLNELEKVIIDIDKIKKYEGNILKNSDNLLEILNLDVNIGRRIERLYIYAHINLDADTLNTNYQELFGKVYNAYVKYSSVSSFIVPELLEYDYSLIEKYIKENEKLKEFERLLKDIYKEKEHVLSKEVENVISNLGNVMNAPEDIYSSLTDSDFKFEDIIIDGKNVELTESNFSVYLKDSNRETRKQAFKSLYKTYGDFKTSIASLLKNEVEKNVIISKLRKYNSSLEATLFSNEIDKKVYLNLIDTVHQNFDSIYRYWNIKKKILNLDELHIYDTYTELESNDNKKYSFDDARNLILEITKPLGEKYVEDLTKAFTNKWIDSINNKGKRGGAYCTCSYDVHPYVLMSYENTLNDVSTLAHELGHAMHYYYASKNQKYQDYEYSIFVAEVASQVNEILLSRYLLDHSNSKEERIKIIDDLLQKYKSTIYRQTMFAEFELFIHEYTEKGNILTSDTMCNKYYELNKLYFGDNVIVDDEIKYEWERIPHFYMNFYVWKYATSFAAAVYIANKIYEGDTNLRDNYLEFLKLGCTKKPIESLELVGLDMSKPDVIEKSIKFMNELLDEYNKYINE